MNFGRVKEFIKNELVLVIAAAAALVSMLFVPVSAAYIEYFDWQVLALLFCLMTVALQQSGQCERNRNCTGNALLF